MQPGALFPRPVLLREEAHTLVGEVRKNLLVEQPILLCNQRMGALADQGEYLRRRRLSGIAISLPSLMRSFSSATRISKNSSRLLDKMHRKRSLSSAGTRRSSAWASTRWLNASTASSRARNWGLILPAGIRVLWSMEKIGRASCRE